MRQKSQNHRPISPNRKPISADFKTSIESKTTLFHTLTWLKKKKQNKLIQTTIRTSILNQTTMYGWLFQNTKETKDMSTDDDIGIGQCVCLHGHIVTLIATVGILTSSHVFLKKMYFRNIVGIF